MTNPGHTIKSDTVADGMAEEMARLAAIVARLRGPDGCPWDREQTLAGLKSCLLEEAYELLETMDNPEPEAHAEELGDLLLQVVFQARIREEQGLFGLGDVARLLTDKLIRRHPHVFGAATVADSDEVLRNWEAIKRSEKDGSRSALDGVPRSLPALCRAQRIQSKAVRVGFDWSDANGPKAKIAEELGEFYDAIAEGDHPATIHEVGDLLFSIVNLCRFLKIDAEDALQVANARFMRRFRDIERRVREEGKSLYGCSLPVLEAHWKAVKAAEPSRTR